MAVSSSRNIRISRHEEEAASADAVVARARLLPSVTATAGGTVLSDQPSAIFGPNSVAMSQREFLSYSLAIQQTLYDFEGNASRYASGLVRAGAQKIETSRIKNLVAIDFALTFIDLLESQKLLALAATEVERLTLHRDNTKALYEEGAITRNDLLQAEVRLSDARQKMLAAVNHRALSEARLNNALSAPLDAAVSAAEFGTASGALPEISPDQGWQLALQGRPEIRIISETLRALELDETAKRAELYPRVTVKGGYDYTENRYQVHQGIWAVTLGLGFNIWSGGSTKAELLKLQAHKAVILQQKEKLLEDIRLEVRKYMLDHATAKERITVTKDAIGQAEENLRINRLRFEEGVGTATEVLDAVTLLSAAETNYYRAVYAAKKAEAAVAYACGKDLTEVYQ